MHRTPVNFPGRQRGAVLYVALIFLVLLALLGVAGMQVASLQERMASNYRATNQAFQRAEGLARLAEAQINSEPTGRFIPRSGERDEQRLCDDPEPVRGSAWADLRSQDDDPDTAVVGTELNDCMGLQPLNKGKGPRNETTRSIWQISAFSTDMPVDPTSDAGVETVFVP